MNVFYVYACKAYIRMSSKGQGFILRCNMEFDCLHVFPVDYIHDTLFTREIHKCNYVAEEQYNF